LTASATAQHSPQLCNGRQASWAPVEPRGPRDFQLSPASCPTGGGGGKLQYVAEVLDDPALLHIPPVPPTNPAWDLVWPGQGKPAAAYLRLASHRSVSSGPRNAYMCLLLQHSLFDSAATAQNQGVITASPPPRVGPCGPRTSQFTPSLLCFRGRG